MRVLLSTPPLHPHQSYNDKFPRFPILNLSLLAASLAPRHQVRVLSLAAHAKKRNFLYETAVAFWPDVIGFSLPSTVSALALEEGIGRIRRLVPSVKIAAGGPFATFEPRFCLDAGCDAVFLNEADFAFARWVDGGAGARMSIGNPEIVEDLDTSPMPVLDCHDFAPRIYSGTKAAALEMSRGCPYACTFCTVHRFGKTYREKSTGRMLEELSRLWARGSRELLFVDNSFGLNASAADALAEGILAAGWKFEFGAYFRADTIAKQPDMMNRLARAGLRYAIVGFESYSDESLNAMNKAANAETNRIAARTLAEAGVFCVGSHIYGAPGETPADIRGTYNAGVRNGGLFKAGLYTPLPGSPLYDRLKEENALASDDPTAMNHIRYQVGDGRRRRSIQSLSLFLFLRYYLHPARWLRLMSRDRWTRNIFTVEYRSLFLRAFSLIKWIAYKRKPRPLFDEL